MEIYIRTRSRDDGTTAWWNKHKNGESYLFTSHSLWAQSTVTGEHFLAGTAFKSIKEAKREGRLAKRMAEFDGDVDVEVTFFRYVGGILVPTKFTRDNKIKK